MDSLKAASVLTMAIALLGLAKGKSNNTSNPFIWQGYASCLPEAKLVGVRGHYPSDNRYGSPVKFLLGAGMLACWAFLENFSTHWCGIGKRDSEDRSFVNVTMADKCCKSHDSCPHYISRWSTKYNLFNWRLYTISHCACDEKFRKCLKKDDSMISRDISRIYFDILQVPCFEIKMKKSKACVAWHWYLECKTYKEWMEAYAEIKETNSK